jgi:hypothetical protein
MKMNGAETENGFCGHLFTVINIVPLKRRDSGTSEIAINMPP